MQTPSFTPLLVVRDGARAIEFFEKALGARVEARFEHGPYRYLGHADLLIGSLRFALTQEVPGMQTDSPQTLGGTPVVLQLQVPDALASSQALEAAGACVVAGPAELLGERMVKLRDPCGHLWLLRQKLFDLSFEQMQAERDALVAQLAPAWPRPPSPPEVTEMVRGKGDEQQAKLSDDEVSTGKRPRIHLVVGPVGAGKSTHASRLADAEHAVWFNLDAWMARLFRPDRPDEDRIAWYTERVARCVDAIWVSAQDVLARGVPVVLELGLVRRRERRAFCRRLGESPVTVHMLDAPRDVRRARVEQRNRDRGDTFSFEVPPEIFELASDLWEPPTEEEIAELGFELMSHHTG